MRTLHALCLEEEHRLICVSVHVFEARDYVVDSSPRARVLAFVSSIIIYYHALHQIKRRDLKRVPKKSPKRKKVKRT